MRLLFSIVCMFISFVAHAQITTPFPQVLQKSNAVDTAQYKVTYQLRYKNHPADKDYHSDIRNVYIGRRHVRDFSDIIFHFDSLSTEAFRRGAVVRSNIQGEPWPIELIVGRTSRNADIKYRMPLQIGVLHYQEDIPQFNWDFTEKTDTVIGYVCSMATVSFAGRNYEAWYTEKIPLPFGPYKFGGLPGLILKIQDSENQYVWEAVGFERSNTPMMTYHYEGEKRCSPEEASKTIARIFKSPFSFIAASMGGGKVMIIDKNGDAPKSRDIDGDSIAYKALEVKN
ncbi:GLPGLI family protein [Porphyromonas gulae]|uniref:Glpgli family protein n=1 Tax=Porphyromonas gulae TaxID=111105 RepID=A0A0A2GTK6_9PORP|nr:GLPGLI family protein [Porphyromonas gulae]KGN84507.1 glpgli family protein [Porphyromonas gulae]KGO03805.1 glpgli family protein [Porphyromonas gulae]